MTIGDGVERAPGRLLRLALTAGGVHSAVARLPEHHDGAGPSPPASRSHR